MDICNLTLAQANRFLTLSGKLKWLSFHNSTANLYFINQNGDLSEVPPCGWWY